MSIADKILQNASNLIKMNTVQENKEIIMDALQYCIDSSEYEGAQSYHCPYPYPAPASPLQYRHTYPWRKYV